MADDEEDCFHSERDFMDALRVLKARSGLSYRDMAAQMSRTDPRHAVARSTLASLLAGDSLPRRPGQVAALVEVLAAELNEPGLAPRYLRAWSRLIAARGEAAPPAAPAPAPSAPLVPQVPADRPAASVRMQPAAPPCAAASPSEGLLSGRQIGAFLFWLALLTVVALVMSAMMPPGVPLWVLWLVNTSPVLLAALVNWLGRDGGRRRAGLRDAPAEYLRAEYRGVEWDSRTGLVGRWPG
jgi:hypothetical protein